MSSTPARRVDVNQENANVVDVSLANKMRAAQLGEDIAMPKTNSNACSTPFNKPVVSRLAVGTPRRALGDVKNVTHETPVAKPEPSRLLRDKQKHRVEERLKLQKSASTANLPSFTPEQLAVEGAPEKMCAPLANDDAEFVDVYLGPAVQRASSVPWSAWSKAIAATVEVDVGNTTEHVHEETEEETKALKEQIVEEHKMKKSLSKEDYEQVIAKKEFNLDWC